MMDDLAQIIKRIKMRYQINHDNRTVTVACIGCKKMLTLKIPDDTRSTTGSAKCGVCSTITKVEFNIRKFYRKDIDIYGHCYINGKKYSVNITDISIGGAGCKFYAKDKINIGDIIRLSYRLPDKQLTEVEEDVKVVRIIKNATDVTIGCECVELIPYSTVYKRKGFFVRENTILLEVEE